MHKHVTPEGLEEHACIDRAVLGLMLELDRQRPWSEEEIARAIRTPGDVRDSLRRLRTSKLIHRWNDLAVASRPAVRFHEITQVGNTACAEDERPHDKAVLECLLAWSADGEGPRSEEQIYEAFGAKKRKQKLPITEAVDRLDGAGLIERRGGRSIASEVAKCFDELILQRRRLCLGRS